MRLSGKVAVVTGAGTGIGRAVALAFAGQGARVCVAGIPAAAVSETAHDIRQRGGEALPHEVDVRDSAAVQGMIRAVLGTYGRLDVLVNNAGIQLYGSAESMDEADWDQVLEVDLRGAFLCTRYAIPAMRAGGGGSIVHMGSVTALLGHPNLIAYSAAKGGLHAMARAAAVELARTGIRVNVVAPGTVDSPILARHLAAHTADPVAARQKFEAIHPVGRVATPEDVAQACLYLASDESSFVTGQTLVVDGGYTVQGQLPD